MNFFVLQKNRDPAEDADTEFVPDDETKTGEPSRCSKCGAFLGMLPLVPPVKVELETFGSKFADLVFGPTNEVLIKRDLLLAFKATQMTGLESLGTVTVSSVRSHHPLLHNLPVYICCSVCRSNTTLDRRRSQLEMQDPPPCNRCGLGGIIKRARRLVIVPNSWDGKDIFVPQGLPGFILTSERFKTFCFQNKVSNCKFTPAKDYSFDFYPWEAKNS